MRLIFLLLNAVLFSISSAAAQTPAEVSGDTAVEAPIAAPVEEPPKRGPSRATVQESLTQLIKTETRLQKEVSDLRRQNLQAQDDIERADLDLEIASKRAELAQVTNRIEELATGIQSDAYSLSGKSEFDLNSELQQLIEPFISIMKSATEEARTIERLRRVEQNAEAQKAVADRAIDGLKVLVENSEDPASKARLQEILISWQEKAQAAEDLQISTQRQLESKLSEQEDVTQSSSNAIREFLSTRGRNLLYGGVAFGVVLTIMRLLGRGIGATARKGRRRSFGRRLFQLVFAVLTIILSYVAMLAVFNSLNDWLLFGLGILLLLAGIWLVLKTLPSLIEQTTLLLNLGAVQEGERIMFNGVPFLVEKLDFYTDLVNPKLRGGHFTIPVSELSGFHSRPVAKDEVWFPCEEGDTVILEDERWGRIVFQSSEAVVMQDDGGSDITFETPAFLGLSPRNMSKGYRTECEFGVDYKHQAIATTEIPRIMAAEVRKDIERMFGAEKVRNVAVEFINAGDSALIYEVEADMTGAAAWQWEEVQFALCKFAVDSCTRNGWNIPFPHISLHKLN